MSVVLGIDAAWTATEPSGVALAVKRGDEWRSVAIAPSYSTFIALAHGRRVDWQASRFEGSAPDAGDLLPAAEALAGAPVDVIAVDMPLSTDPITCRRDADRAISLAFGAAWCSTHSPSAVRPGRISDPLRRDLEHHGFQLAVADADVGQSRRLIEVYPHVALLALMSCERRVPYKVSHSVRYWKDAKLVERRHRLISEWRCIAHALGRVMREVDLPLPPEDSVGTLAGLKRYEDSLDAWICAWTGIRFLDRKACVSGNDGAAGIWVPLPE